MSKLAKFTSVIDYFKCSHKSKNLLQGKKCYIFYKVTQPEIRYRIICDIEFYLNQLVAEIDLDSVTLYGSKVRLL